MQNDRDRLIELIRQGKDMTPCEKNSEYNCKGVKCEDCESQSIADHLLSNSVIAPPCKVGDKVYYIHETYWDKDYKKYIRTKSLKQNILQILERPDDKLNLMLEVISFDYSNINDWLNGQIFLTKEEAKKALERSKGNA